MPTLGSAIVKHGVASMSDVERALAHQTMHGGDLATNLLEVAHVSEADLTQGLAAAYGLDPARVGELPRSSETVLKLVPGDLAQRQCIYPLAEQEGALVLAVGQPLPSEVEEDLSFALGVRVEQRVAPLVRICQAINRDYGQPLERRMLRLLAKLEGRPDPSPSSAPAPSPEAQRALSLPGPDGALAVGGLGGVVADSHGGDVQAAPGSAPGPAQLEGPADEAASRSARAPAHEWEADGAQGAGPSHPPSLHVPLRRGPYTAASAEQDLTNAGSRDEVVRAFFDFASQYFEYAALFVVHAEIAEGREARGPGADRRQIRSIGVPLDLPSALHTVQQEGRWRLAKLTGTALDVGLARDLQRTTQRSVLLLPIVVRKRCVMILYGDHGDTDVELSHVGEVIAFAPLVARALERIIIARKRGVLRQLSRPGQGLDPAIRVIGAPRLGQRGPGRVPRAQDRAAALAHALEPSTPSRFGPDQQRAPQGWTPGPGPAPLAAGPPSLGASPPSPAAQPRFADRPPPPHTAAKAPQSRAVTATPTVPVGAGPGGVPSEPAGIHDAETKPAPRVVPRVQERSRQAWAPTAGPDRDGQRGPATAATAVSGAPVFAPKRRSVPVRRDSEPPEEGWDADPAAPPFLPKESLTAPGLGRKLETEVRAATGAARPAARPEPASTAGAPAGSAPAQTPDGPTLEVVAEEDILEDLTGELVEVDPGSSAQAAEAETLEQADRDTQTAETGDGDGPDISVGLASPDDGWATEAARVEEAERYAPSSRAQSFPARVPQPAHQSSKELSLPSVIVDTSSDCRALVNKLLAGSREAERQLVQMGKPAVAALLERFPGPVSPDAQPDASGTRLRAAQRGPVLHALARLGHVAVPQLVQRAAHPDEPNRRWAVRLLGETPCAASAKAAADHLVDPDASVRSAALEAALRLQADADARRVLCQRLAELAADSSRPEDARCLALAALRDLRDPQSVPSLIRSLEDPSADIVQAAGQGLQLICRQDFGLNARRWREWWKTNRARHRVQWLIDALTHEDPTIRRAAGEELKGLTKEYFGYYDDLPRKERARAQRRYRHWWDTKGKALFR
jgi:hypothetical protein